MSVSPSRRASVANIVSNTEQYKAIASAAPEYTEFVTQNELLLLTPVKLHVFSPATIESMVFVDSTFERSPRLTSGSESPLHTSIMRHRSLSPPIESTAMWSPEFVPVLASESTGAPFVLSQITLNEVESCVQVPDSPKIRLKIRPGPGSCYGSDPAPSRSTVSFRHERRPERLEITFRFVDMPHALGPQVAFVFRTKIKHYLARFRQQRTPLDDTDFDVEPLSWSGFTCSNDDGDESKGNGDSPTEAFHSVASSPRRRKTSSASEDTSRWCLPGSARLKAEAGGQQLPCRLNISVSWIE